MLHSLANEPVIVGLDLIDEGTEKGFIGYGFLESQIPPELLKTARPDTQVPASITLIPLGRELGQRWIPGLNLITLEQLETLPHGTVLYSSSGNRLIVGLDRIGKTTRFGFLACGFLDAQIPQERRTR